MRVLITGASGNIGKGLIPRLKSAGHDLVLSDLNLLPDDGAFEGIPFVQADAQIGVGLERAAEGCDMIVHLPAWHGIHWRAKTEADFWRLNVDGTFWAFQAAQARGISRFVFLSSQAWHGHYDKYGFTKRIGEELCEYNRVRHGIRYVSLRPQDLTPWGTDFLHRYGRRFLYGGVDREDVLDSIACAVERLARPSEGEAEGLIVDSTRANAFTEAQLANWTTDPLGTCESIFPGSRELVERFAINIKEKPHLVGELGWDLIGYQPTRHFGTFIAQLKALLEEGGEELVRSQVCQY